MPKRSLVVVESPTKVKTIQKYLDGKFIVKASMGHVRDLPKSQLGVDPKKNFKPKYVISPTKQKVLEDLKKAAEKSEALYVATDPDREGEAIGWHLAQELAVDKKKVYRITFNEITERAVKAAFTKPGKIDMHKVDAQQARRVLDRLVGYSLSPLLWEKVQRGLSAGRVQSVAVRLIVDREREIAAFVPVEYWSLHARLSAKLPPEFEATLREVDSAATESMPGVVSVVRDGNFLAVVAEKEFQAIAAMRRLAGDAQWDERETLPDQTHLPNVLRELEREVGTVAEQGSPQLSGDVFKATFTRPYQIHGSIGPSCARKCGAATACWTSRFQSSTPIKVCATKPMMRVPPGEPTISTGRPASSSTKVGAMLDNGRLPPSMRFATGLPPCSGSYSKSVSWLFRMKPRKPSTVSPITAVTRPPRIQFRYFPTSPFEFARPLGKREETELSRRRGDSMVQQATMTMLAGCSCRSPLEST